MDQQTFRQAMGKFATGITIITTKEGTNIHGMTANAFMSVSLDPQLVVVSINNRAKMLENINQRKKFAISILSDRQVDISMHFSGQRRMNRAVEFEELNGLPVIKDALVHIACDVVQRHQAGDHTLFIGKVLDLKINNGQPLTFFGGNYGTFLPFDVNQ